MGAATATADNQCCQHSRYGTCHLSHHVGGDDATSQSGTFCTGKQPRPLPARPLYEHYKPKLGGAEAATVL